MLYEITKSLELLGALPPGPPPGLCPGAIVGGCDGLPAANGFPQKTLYTSLTFTIATN